MRFQWTTYMGPSTQQTVAVVLIVSTQEVRGVAGKTSRALVYCTWPSLLPHEWRKYELSDLYFDIPVKLVVPLNILRTYFDVFSLLWWFLLKFYFLPMGEYKRSLAVTTSGGWKVLCLESHSPHLFPAPPPPDMRHAFSTIETETEPMT